MTDNNPDARKPLILIAEDVESNYKLLEIILKKEYELLWAKNGKEAVDYALERHPDAVLMDIKMPVMDGIEALKEIKAMDPGAKVVMCSAMGQEAMVVEAIKLGALDFIVKPFTDVFIQYRTCNRKGHRRDEQNNNEKHCGKPKDNLFLYGKLLHFLLPFCEEPAPCASVFNT